MNPPFLFLVCQSQVGSDLAGSKPGLVFRLSTQLGSCKDCRQADRQAGRQGRRSRAGQEGIFFRVSNQPCSQHVFIHPSTVSLSPHYATSKLRTLRKQPIRPKAEGPQQSKLRTKHGNLGNRRMERACCTTKCKLKSNHGTQNNKHLKVLDLRVNGIKSNMGPHNLNDQ